MLEKGHYEPGGGWRPSWHGWTRKPSASWGGDRATQFYDTSSPQKQSSRMTSLYKRSSTTITHSYHQIILVFRATRSRREYLIPPKRGFWGTGIGSVWPLRYKNHLLAHSSLILAPHEECTKERRLFGVQPLINYYLHIFSPGAHTPGRRTQASALLTGH